MNNPIISLDKKNIPILLLEGIHQNAVDALKNAGYENITQMKGALDEDALIDTLQNYKMVGIRSRTKITKTVLDACPHLVAIGCFCIGTNQVDLYNARLHGVPVFNAPFSNTRSVAELVLGQMILLMRNAIPKNAQMQRGEWVKSANHAYEVRGKTLGIIGYGHIGSQVSILAEALGMNVIFFDVEDKLPLGNAVSVGSMDELLAKADIVTLHVPETAQTNKMINADAIAKMKDHSVLINAARGTVVDIPALHQALILGKLKGAAIDVFPYEPSSNDEPFTSELVGMDNVFLTPHIGGSTAEAQENIAKEVADKFVKYSDNGSTMGAVNFPELSLPQQAGLHRVLHIHENKAGVMRELNRVFSEHEINIEGQYLRTMNEIGYVVMDIRSSQDEAKALLNELKSIDGTIRARVLF